MPTKRPWSPRPDYGIDAPGVMGAMFGLGAGSLVLASAAVGAWRRGWPWLLPVALTLAGGSAYGLGMGGYMLYSARVGKLRERGHLLDAIPWRGNERVLDIGCGRGLMLVAAAQRLSNGYALGVDIWRAEDQSANRPGGALANAASEGVAARVEVQTADMRRLPLASASCDVIVSRWAVHNIEQQAERVQALREMLRVLKPGGYLLLADIQNKQEYATQLASFGMVEVQERTQGWQAELFGVLSGGSFRPFVLLGRKAA